jgi:hypothetical protein
MANLSKRLHGGHAQLSILRLAPPTATAPTRTEPALALTRLLPK